MKDNKNYINFFDFLNISGSVSFSFNEYNDCNDNISIKNDSKIYLILMKLTGYLINMKIQ